jgi:hypothetical protein
MTKKQVREAVYKACEMIETGQQEYSCNAIDVVTNWSILSQKYAKFSIGNKTNCWVEDMMEEDYNKSSHTELCKSKRIVNLLMFAETYGEL